jgi:hypothetical protein
MSKHDLKRLSHAANRLAARLQGLRLTSLKFASAFPAEDTDNGGWYTKIATWAQHGVTIGISLDKYSRAQRRSFWVGFWSRNYSSIERLFVDLPLEWKPQGPVLTTKHGASKVDSSGNEIWIMTRPLSRAQYGQPIAEDYRGDYKYFGLYDRTDELGLDQATSFLESVIIAQGSGTDDESTDIRHIERRKDLDATAREQLILARCGQGHFRAELETLWNGCPISHHKRRELLRASHIMPWRDANDSQRLDKHNGILLSANLDALFDKYLISFGEDGRLLVSDDLNINELTSLGLAENIVLTFSEEQQLYLKHHRDRFQKKTRKSQG